MSRRRKNRYGPKNLAEGESALETLVALDFKVRQKSEYHFRINDRLDVWPSGKTTYDIRSGSKGHYDDLVEFVKNHFELLELAVNQKPA